MACFKDASRVPDENGNVFCYRSSLLAAEEGLVNGRPVALGYNTAGYPLNVLSNCPTRLNPDDFGFPLCFGVCDRVMSTDADGKDNHTDTELCADMSLESFEKHNGGGNIHTAAVFKSRVKPLGVCQHTILDGTDMLTRYLEIENLSDTTLDISRIAIHGGGIEAIDLNSEAQLEVCDAGEIYSCGYFASSAACREGEFVTEPLPVGKKIIECKFNTGRFRHPAAFIFNKLTGDTYYVQVGWSGGVRLAFNLESTGGRVLLSYTAELAGHLPLIRLKAGEKITTPEVHFCAVHGGLDEAVNAGIAHIRKSVLNNPFADGSALLVGAGMGAEHDMSVETTKSFAEQMSKMGAEVFIVDAGWYCPPGRETEWYTLNGTNIADSGRYPNGIEEIRDYCRSLGMKFAMWLEPERLGNACKAFKEHPEWFPKSISGDEFGGFVDMTIPDAAQWVEDEISRVVEEYKLDLLRIDYNIGGNEPFGFNGDGECINLRQYTAVMQMYARLKAKYPDVIFENCASGGARTDLGHMKNFNHTWVSDNQKMPRSIEITNGMTMVLPPERVDRLFAGMGCHASGDIKAHIRNTMLTHMSLNVIAPACLRPNDEVMKFVARSVRLYKDYIRPMLPTSLVYHHTPDRASAAEKGFTALEVCAPDGSIGFAALFALPMSGEKRLKFVPDGIKAGKTYTVYTDNDRCEYEAKGSEIQANGIAVRLPCALSSELIMYREK